MKPQNGRAAAAEAVRRLNEQNAYSNCVVHALLSSVPLEPREKALATAIIYGTVERRLTIDFLLSKCSTRPLKKLHPTVLALLQTAVCQLLYMDRIPQSAAVNETVKLTRSMGQPAASGFVNAVLRGVLRQHETLLSRLGDSAEGLSLRYSCPVDWIRFWEEAYGRETMLLLLAHINGAPPAYIRVNTALTTATALCDRLRAQGNDVLPMPDLTNCLQLNSVCERNPLEKAEENCYYYQDKASQYACAALSVRPGDRVADVCAAPGGKTLTISQYLEGRGEVLAGDIYPGKCATIRCRAVALQADTVKVVQRDASEACPPEWVGRFDKVLCDVPCSGLGVIRRKPEIRYKRPEDFCSLPDLQYRILDASAAMVAPGGVLQYSTCTLNPAENEAVALRFLKEHQEFAPRILPLSSCFAASGLEPDWHITLFPHLHGSDGFFIAGFVRLV